MNALSKYTLAACLVLSTTSCASMMTGKNDMLDITSTPSGAHFTTSMGDSGVTPAIVEVPGKRDVTFTFQMDGYRDATKVAVPHMSKWVWGNLFFFGFVGLGVDFLGETSLTHDDVDVTLRAL
ncbi:MAG: hypothetical protein JKY61_01880 [Planctomycetes bacterium]|nr:hypothetical protein [Planctomycetota bacterium]